LQKTVKMTNTELYTLISTLPHPVQNELMDYLEFLLQKHKGKREKKYPQAGCMKGTFEMSLDFNEPLPDFKEYMK